jgi:ABC transporter with metal-binding/Fe-S-binding domain ATP-binding protein
MKVAVLFSGGKDSCYATYLAKQEGNKLTCLISIFSENPDSFMFHTPNIKLVEKQAQIMDLPLITQTTKGEKEEELKDLEKAIKEAKKKHKIQGIVTGALYSEYQTSRIEKICKKLKLKCINPLWKKDEIDYLKELIKNNFKVIITGVAAHPLDETWLGRELDNAFITDVKELSQQHQIHPAGEGGEFETFVLHCPLFKKELKVTKKEIKGEGNSWRMVIGVQ